MDEIRKNIIERLEQRGLSMAALSRKLNKNAAYLQQFLSGKQHTLPYEERLIIAEFLDMKPQALGIAPPARPHSGSTGGGFSQDAVPYIPPRGHFLSATPKHFWMLTQMSNSLDQHSEKIKKGDVLVFDLNAAEVDKIPSMTIVAVQMCARAELLHSFGTMTRIFIAPNKLITNSSELNEIIAIDDETLPFIPVLRGSFKSIIRELN